MEVAFTPCPKWDGGGLAGSGTSRSCSQSARRIAGSYGSLVSLANGTGELLYRFTRKGHENASVRTGGRRRRSSQRPGCNDQDKVKVRQGKLSERLVKGLSEESR